MDLNEQHPTPDAPRGGANGVNTPAETTGASRRTLLRAGMVGVPVVTTLMARPAWAQQVCMSAAAAVSVEAAGFTGSSYERATQNAEYCAPGNDTQSWTEAYAALLEQEQQKLESGSSEYSLMTGPMVMMASNTEPTFQERLSAAVSEGIPNPTARGRGQGQGRPENPGENGQNGEQGNNGRPPQQDVPQVTLAMLSLMYGTECDAPDGCRLFLGTMQQAFGRGPSLYFDQVLAGRSDDAVFAAAYLNALNRARGIADLRRYPLSIEEVVGLYNREPVGGKRWSHTEAVHYLQMTLA